MDPNKLGTGATVWVYLGKVNLPPSWEQQLSAAMERRGLLQPPDFERATVIALASQKGRQRMETQVRVRLERTGASITVSARKVYPRQPGTLDN